MTSALVRLIVCIAVSSIIVAALDLNGEDAAKHKARHGFFESIRSSFHQRHGDQLPGLASLRSICDACLVTVTAAQALLSPAQAGDSVPPIDPVCESVPAENHVICHMIVEQHGAELREAARAGTSPPQVCAALDLCHGTGPNDHHDEVSASLNMLRMRQKLGDIHRRLARRGGAPSVLDTHRPTMDRYEQMDARRRELQIQADAARREHEGDQRPSAQPLNFDMSELLRKQLELLGVTPPPDAPRDELERLLQVAVASRDTMFASALARAKETRNTNDL